LGAGDRWGNIEGVISFFRDHSMGAPGTWVSYVDSGIVEGIERGVVIALGRSDDGYGNPGSARWASYLTRLHNGELTVRDEHDRAWSEAEQASTDHGVDLAENVHGIKPSAVERRFFLFTQFYRWTLRNRPAVLDMLLVSGGLINPVLPFQRVPFLDWFTDVSNPVPSRKGCEVAYAVARLDPVAGEPRPTADPGARQAISPRLERDGAGRERDDGHDQRRAERPLEDEPLVRAQIDTAHANQDERGRGQRAEREPRGHLPEDGRCPDLGRAAAERRRGLRQ
ncbi:hypothetical protein ACFQ1S_33575, partial [Kibdelosporangium lantanae]